MILNYKIHSKVPLPLRYKTDNRGFTIVELMVAIGIGAIVLAAVMTSFLSQHRSYLAQDDVVELQQNGRIAFDMLTRDIRGAGYDPNNLGAGIITATPNNFEFTREDAAAANNLERVEYSLFDAFQAVGANDGLIDDLALQIWDSLGNTAGRQVIAENISQLEFQYLDNDGNVTADLNSIRSVQISFLATAANPDQQFTNTMTYTSASGNTWGSPYNDNLRRRLFITTVECRNLGL